MDDYLKWRAVSWSWNLDCALPFSRAADLFSEHHAWVKARPSARNRSKRSALRGNRESRRLRSSARKSVLCELPMASVSRKVRHPKAWHISRRLRRNRFREICSATKSGGKAFIDRADADVFAAKVKNVRRAKLLTRRFRRDLNFRARVLSRISRQARLRRRNPQSTPRLEVRDYNSWNCGIAGWLANDSFWCVPEGPTKRRSGFVWGCRAFSRDCPSTRKTNLRLATPKKSYRW